jgi:hypothetical protein
MLSIGKARPASWFAASIRLYLRLECWDCRLYDGNTDIRTFTNSVGSVSTTLALALDVYVFKQATRLGKYNAMQDLDHKRDAAPFHDNDNLAGFNSAEDRTPGQTGYTVPDEQFSYDTSYRGPHPAHQGA